MRVALILTGVFAVSCYLVFLMVQSGRVYYRHDDTPVQQELRLGPPEKPKPVRSDTPEVASAVSGIRHHLQKAFRFYAYATTEHDQKLGDTAMVQVMVSYAQLREIVGASDAQQRYRDLLTEAVEVYRGHPDLQQRVLDEHQVFIGIAQLYRPR